MKTSSLISPPAVPFRSRARRRLPLICAASIALSAGVAEAADGTWTSSTDLLWSDITAWSGGTVADGSGFSAFFNTLDLLAPMTVQLDSPRTIGKLFFADTDPLTPANWTLGNNGSPANVLTLDGPAPTINVTSMGAGSTVTLGTALAGTAGLTFSGTGTILSAGNIGSTYTGGTLLQTRVETTNVAPGNLTIFGSAVAANALTFNGGYFKIFNTTAATSAGSLLNDLVVNTTGTLEYSGRSFTSGTLTGSGVFNVITHFVRSDNGGNWSGFTGTINVSSGDAGLADFRQTTYNGFANATLNLGTNANMYFTPNQANNAVPYAGTNVFIGALSGVSSAILRGGPIAGRVTNFIIGAKNIDTEFAGSILEQSTAASDILKQGSGTLTLSGGTSAYNGPTRIDAGTLAVAVLANGGAVSSIGQSSNAADRLILNGGTFKYLGAGHSTNRLMTVGTMSPVTIDASGSGAVNFTNTGSVVLSGFDTARAITFAGSSAAANNFSPIIPDNGIGLTSVTKSGAGTWSLSGANTYTGVTTIGGGVLSVSSLADGGLPSNLGASTNVADNLVINGGTLRYTGAATTTDRAFTAGTSGATLDASGTGALVLSNTGATALAGTDAARTITLTGTSTAANTLAAVLGDNGLGATSLAKTGAGRWVISGANTYSGPTTISGGVLSVQNPSGSGTGTGAVTVASGGALGGTGTIAGAVTVNSGGKVEPGAGIGTLTLGSVSLSTGSILNYEFSLAPANDLLVVQNSGGLTLNSTAFNLFVEGTLTTWSNVGTFNLVQYSGAIGGTGLDATWTTASGSNPHILNPAGGRTYQFGTSGGFITLTIATTGVISNWNVNGGGSWSTAGNWSAGIPNGASHTANFLNAITSPQTVSLNGSRTVGAIQFANANIASPTTAYTIAQGSGGSLILDNGAAPAQISVAGSHAISAPVSLVSNAAVDVNAAADALTISGALSGAALTKSGAGALILTAANSHSATTISGGVVEIRNSGALGAGTLTFTGDGTLRAGAAALAPTNNVVIGAGVTATLDSQAVTLTVGGVISETGASGALRKIGPGTVVLGDANTYSGATTIEQGTLRAGTLADGGVASSIGQSSNAAANLVLDGGTLAHTGAASATNRLLTLGAAGGTLDASGTDVLQWTNSGAIALTGADVARTFTLAGTSIFDNTFAPTIGDNLTGATSLTKAGTGTWILASANTFTGTTTITGGILKLGHSLALQSSTLDYNGQGGTLGFGTLVAATLGNLTGSQNLALENDFAQGVNLTVGDAQNTTYAGALSDGTGFGAALTKIGFGALTLIGANSYTGATTVNAGTLQLEAGGVINGGGVQVNGNTTFTVNGGSLTSNALSNLNNVAGGVTFNLFSGSATFNAGLNALGNANQGWLINAAGGTLTAASMTLGRFAVPTNTTEPTAGATTAGLYISGATVAVTGALNMGIAAGANSSVSVRIDAGSLIVDGTTTIGLNNGGRWSVIDVAGGTFTSHDATNGIFIGGPLVGNAVLLVRGGTATAEIIKMGQAASGTSVINLTGGSLYLGSGGIVQNSTVLSQIRLGDGVLGAKADWSSLLDMEVTGAATAQAADAASVAHDITLGGAMTGAGSLTKTGGGVLNLDGAQSYAALTTTAGITNLDGSFTNGTSIVTANATLNISASQTIGELNIGAGATVTLTASPASGEAPAFGEIAGADLTAPAAQFAAVPEPGAFGLLAFGALGLLARRRRA